MSDMRQFVATPTVEELEAEIERLQDEIINLEALAKDRYCTMQTEIERLEAALRRSR